MTKLTQLKVCNTKWMIFLDLNHEFMHDLFTHALHVIRLKRKTGDYEGAH